MERKKLLHTTIKWGKLMEKLLLNPIFKFSTSLSSSNRAPANCHTNCYCAHKTHTHLAPSSSSSLVVGIIMAPLFFVALVITFRFVPPFLFFFILGYDDTIIDRVVSGRYPWRGGELIICSHSATDLFRVRHLLHYILNGFSKHEKIGAKETE